MEEYKGKESSLTSHWSILIGNEISVYSHGRGQGHLFIQTLSHSFPNLVSKAIVNKWRLTLAFTKANVLALKFLGQVPESLLKCLTSQREFDCLTILVFSKQHACLRRFITACTINSAASCWMTVQPTLPKVPHLCSSSHFVHYRQLYWVHSYHALLLLLFEIHYQLCPHPWPALPIQSMSAVELKIPGSLEYSRAERFEVSMPILPKLQCSESRSRYNPLYSHQLSRALSTDTGRWEYRTMDPPCI